MGQDEVTPRRGGERSFYERYSIHIWITFSVAALCLLWGIVIYNAGNSHPLQPGTIVRCDSFNKIVDRYAIPGPEYHVLLNTGFDDVIPDQEQYSKALIGKYVKYSLPPFGWVYTFQELNESETGYRNACRVISYV